MDVYVVPDSFVLCHLQFKLTCSCPHLTSISRVFPVKPFYRCHGARKPVCPVWTAMVSWLLLGFQTPNGRSFGHLDSMTWWPILLKMMKMASGLRFWGMFLSLLAILKNLEMTCSMKWSMKYGVWYLPIWFQIKILVSLGVCGIWYLLFVDSGTSPSVFGWKQKSFERFLFFF